MKKEVFLSYVCMACVPLMSFADFKPIMSLSLGSDRTNVYSTKSITLIPPFQNAYIGTNHYDTEAVIGLFLGAETFFSQNWAWQLGLSYFQSSVFTENGNVYQFSDPAFNNLTYQYNIQSRRIYLETKVSPVWRQIWHPYLSLGAGEAFNKAYAYIETPVSSENLPMAQPFAGHTTQSFTYLGGIGMDIDMGKNVRMGVGYRFVNLGNASLGMTPLQSSVNTISNSHLYTNEFLLQLTIIG